jgi:poly [ADP-ribose] polymerase
VTKTVTHLISTPQDFDRATSKITTAQKYGIHIIDFQWLLACEQSKAREPEQNYDLAAPQPKPTPIVAIPIAAPPVQPANAGVKRSASPTSNPSAAPKKPRSTKGKAKAKAAAAVVDDDGDDDDTKDPPATSKTVAKSESKPEPVIGNGQVSKKPDVRIPIDEGCPLINYLVYIDPDGVIYDASLNQTNASANNNKFYRIQVLAACSLIYLACIRTAADVCLPSCSMTEQETTRLGPGGVELVNMARVEFWATGP